jgi:hypothetical protein
MSNNIELPNDTFNFNRITLANPVILQQQSYFSKIMSDNNELMIQMPKCTSKQGFVNSSKRYYCDLMFSSENRELLSWFENLEERIQKLIYEQRKSWFHEDVEPDDIENIFTSSLRSFKSGKFFLCRTMLNSPRMLQTSKLSIFDENENPLEMNIVDENTEFVSILHIHGIKFSSRNFQIYVEMKQMMVLNNNSTFSKCLIQSGSGIQRENVTNETDKIVKVNEPLEEEMIEPLEEENKVELNIDTHNIDNETIGETEVKEISIENIENIEDLNIDNNLAEVDITLGDNKIVEEKEESLNEADINEHLEINQELPSELQEIDLHVDNLETITLKNKQDLYLQEYKEAKEKAKKARITALKALLKAKNIKDKYLIDTMELSDEEYEDDNTTIHTSDLESNADSLESFSDDDNENEENLVET